MEYQMSNLYFTIIILCLLGYIAIPMKKQTANMQSTNIQSTRANIETNNDSKLTNANIDPIKSQKEFIDQQKELLNLQKELINTQKNLINEQKDIIDVQNNNLPFYKQFQDINFFDTPNFTAPLNITKYTSISGEDKVIIDLFKDKKGNPRLNGLFLEMGAIDGTLYSNTVVLEESYGWRGLLIEPNPTFCGKLLTSPRERSIKLCAGICTGSYMNFSIYNHTNRGAHGKSEYLDGYHGNNKQTIKITCTKLGNVLNNLNVKRINMFVLDVEASEAEVLETFDWNIKVDYWFIEALLEIQSAIINNQKVIKMMKEHGYVGCNIPVPYPNTCWKNPNITQTELNDYYK